MVDKTLTVTAPEELLDATVVAFAALGTKTDPAMSEQDHAIEMMLDDFRTKVVAHNDKLRRKADREAARAAALAEDEAMKAARGSVTVTIQ